MKKSEEIILSILIPTLGRSDSVLKAVKSSNSKSNDKIEIIVVEDGSSESVFEELKEKLSLFLNVRVYRNKNNLGLTANWNKCVEHASGKWLCLMCSDDNFTESAVDRILKIINDNPEPALIIQDITIDKELVKVPAGPETVRNLRLPIVSGNVWHRAITENIGGFDEKIKYSPDAEYWARIAFYYPVIKIKEPTAVFNVTGNNYMFTTWEKKDFLEQIDYLSEKVLGYQALSEKEIKEKTSIGLNKTVITIIYAALAKKKFNLFLKYLARFLAMNVNILKWNSPIKAFLQLLLKK